MAAGEVFGLKNGEPVMADQLPIHTCTLSDFWLFSSLSVVIDYNYLLTHVPILWLCFLHSCCHC